MSGPKDVQANYWRLAAACVALLGVWDDDAYIEQGLLAEAIEKVRTALYGGGRRMNERGTDVVRHEHCDSDLIECGVEALEGDRNEWRERALKAEAELTRLRGLFRLALSPAEAQS
jgi:hypothetical protein